MQMPEENAQRFVNAIDKGIMKEKIGILKIFLQGYGVEFNETKANAVLYTKLTHGNMLVQRFAIIYDNYAIMISIIAGTNVKVVKGIVELDTEGLKLINELFSHEEEEVTNEKH
ncbi:hypothetical protein SPV2_gp08 [Sulfolobus polyhedral virus 2]|uniref:Uncharacterized protein n=1 Tax=Sulfolobus polyhedral virus 2 TaxID=2493125 RepID=A0A3Q8Q436_9VIRU|nr:hypothetical protein KM458_gp08 [Sulfolobus polyhedral virus 2]AZI76007.1 hypothetical protein SPV2_gp08 [Sulfolobus polyhedral virus 2]